MFNLIIYKKMPLKKWQNYKDDTKKLSTTIYKWMVVHNVIANFLNLQIHKKRRNIKRGKAQGNFFGVFHCWAQLDCGNYSMLHKIAAL